MIRASRFWKTPVGVGLVWLPLLVPTFAQKASHTPLSVAFSADPSMTIQDDQRGIYIDQIDNVRAEFTYGNFYLDTNEMKGDGGRRVTISTICSGTIGGIPCPAPGPKDVYLATIDPADVHMNLVDLALGQSWDKRFAITWAEGDYTYHLRWNYPVDPQHGNVGFTCTAAGVNGLCIQWTAGPTGSVGLFAKSNARKSAEVYVTTADMPFVMTLTKQP